MTKLAALLAALACAVPAAAAPDPLLEAQRDLQERLGSPRQLLASGLCRAARDGNVAEARVLLDRGADPTVHALTFGASAAQIAIYLGRRELVELFLDRSLPFQYETEDGLGLLHMAASSDRDGWLLRRLLAARLDVDARTSQGGATAKLPLSKAAEAANVRGIELLTQAGADLRRRDNATDSPFTPLYSAIDGLLRMEKEHGPERWLATIEALLSRRALVTLGAWELLNHSRSDGDPGVDRARALVWAAIFSRARSCAADAAAADAAAEAYWRISAKPRHDEADFAELDRLRAAIEDQDCLALIARPAR